MCDGYTFFVVEMHAHACTHIHIIMKVVLLERRARTTAMMVMTTRYNRVAAKAKYLGWRHHFLGSAMLAQRATEVRRDLRITRIHVGHSSAAQDLENME